MTTTPTRLTCCLATTIALTFFVAGCSLIQLGEETKILQSSTILVGKVTSSLAFWDMPVVVAAYSKEKNKRTIVHYTTLHEPGPYELIVPQGNCYVVAFGDKNNNLKYDQGEPAGQYADAEPLSAPAGGVVSAIDIVISSPNSGKIDFPINTTLPPRKTKKSHYTSPGAMANLDNVLFSDEFGRKGFQTPLEFFKEVGGNIYFLEPYDPNKIPILFVHGAAGSPQNWKTFFASIDRTKYQPWFFYYPSGSSLDSMSNLLFWKLLNLQSKYKFKELCITAHSMGGLVVRSFLVNHGNVFPSITKFISISTPWGGEALAETGVKYSPAVIPAWRDMQPNGEFIELLFSKKMPDRIDYFLFFGHKGNRNPLRPNNDKVVTLESQLDQRSQKDAKMIYGFNEDHISILSSEQVLSQYRAILASAYEQSSDEANTPGNKLRVDFSFDFPEDLPRPMAILLLRPADKSRSGIWFYLNPEDSGQEQGPFPKGDYDVYMLAPAFAPDPVSMSITIEDDSVPNVEFTMKPRGTLTGYVVKAKKTNNQAGAFLEPDTEIEIQTIILEGDGITRTLIPQNEAIDFAEHYLPETDYAARGEFYFYGLPEGEYELTINASGYKQYSKSHKVRPGFHDGALNIELVE